MDLPDDVVMHILTFLGPSDLTPITKKSLYLFRSNVVWKRMFKGDSTNYFKQYIWKQRLINYQFRYKLQWSQGCLGRLVPPKFIQWTPAPI